LVCAQAMARHVAVFRLQATAAEADTNTAVSALQSLPDAIPEVTHLTADLDKTETTTSIALVADFLSEDDLNSFRRHPRYLQVVEKFLTPLVADGGASVAQIPSFDHASKPARVARVQAPAPASSSKEPPVTAAEPTQAPKKEAKPTRDAQAGDKRKDDLEADISQLQSLIGKCERPANKKRLQQSLADFNRKLGTEVVELDEEDQKLAAEVMKSGGYYGPSGGLKQSAAASRPAPAASAPSAGPAAVSAAKSTAASAPPPSGPWKEITQYAFDAGKYDGDTVTVDIRLKGVEALPAENITCQFGEASLDLKIQGYGDPPANYRMYKTNLEKDIVPGESSFLVKKNHVILKLRKEKAQYGYEAWQDLTTNRRRTRTKEAKGDPMAGLMDIMKDMYEDGDDSTKKAIGEAMLKSRQQPPAM